MTYLTKNEVTVKTYSDALSLAEILLNNDYVVMISKEEHLYVVNYEWSERSDRNDVIFVSRDTFEMERYDEEGD